MYTSEHTNTNLGDPMERSSQNMMLLVVLAMLGGSAFCCVGAGIALRFTGMLDETSASEETPNLIVKNDEAVPEKLSRPQVWERAKKEGWNVPPLPVLGPDCGHGNPSFQREHCNFGF